MNIDSDNVPYVQKWTLYTFQFCVFRFYALIFCNIIATACKTFYVYVKMNYTDFLHCILMIWCRKEETFIDLKTIKASTFIFFTNIVSIFNNRLRSFVTHLFSVHLNLQFNYYQNKKAPSNKFSVKSVRMGQDFAFISMAS